VVTGLGLACASGDPPKPKMAPATPPDPAPAAGAAPAPKAAAGPCTDDCLLLLEKDARDLQNGGFCDDCPSDGCSGWPREPLTCEEVDYLRNCMYARLGYTFDKAEEWREVFDKEAWYEPNERFRWDDVSSVQVRNANWLKKKKDRRDCVR
jgi:hypothetical protein